MRVLMCSGSERGGFAVYSDRLVDWLRRCGIDVCFAAPPGRADGALPIPATKWGEEIAGDGRLRLYSLRISESFQRGRALLRAVQAVQPDVVHFQTPIAKYLDPLLLRRIRRWAPIVVTIHNATPHEGARRQRALEYRRWRQADALVVHGDEARRTVVAAAPRVPVHVVPVDLLVRPQVSTTREEARAELSLDSTPVVLLLGLVRPYKGLDLLAQAWPDVRAAVPGARLFVVGSAARSFPALENLLALPGVERRPGWLSDEEFNVWAAAADVIVLPYRHGVHSGILHRAVAKGTPVIASPPLAEEVAHYRAGRVIELDPGAWAAAITDALGPAPLPPPRPGADGARTAEQTIAVYEDVLLRRRQRQGARVTT